MVSFVLVRWGLGLEARACFEKGGNGPQPVRIARRLSAGFDAARQMQRRAAARIGGLCEDRRRRKQRFDRGGVPSLGGAEKSIFRGLCNVDAPVLSASPKTYVRMIACLRER